MENKNHNNNGFGSGFVLGLLIGVIVTLLVTTKKGRELFKEITEKGLDRFSDLEKKLQETTDEFEEIEEGDDYIPEKPRSVKLAAADVADEEEHDHHHHEEKNGHSHKPHPVRRFFRSKKS